MYAPASSARRQTAAAAHGVGATATLLRNGQVLFAGGVILKYPGPGDTLAFAHLYDPGP